MDINVLTQLSAAYYNIVMDNQYPMDVYSAETNWSLHTIKPEHAHAVRHIKVSQLQTD